MHFWKSKHCFWCNGIHCYHCYQELALSCKSHPALNNKWWVSFLANKSTNIEFHCYAKYSTSKCQSVGTIIRDDKRTSSSKKRQQTAKERLCSLTSLLLIIIRHLFLFFRDKWNIIFGSALTHVENTCKIKFHDFFKSSIFSFSFFFVFLFFTLLFISFFLSFSPFSFFILLFILSYVLSFFGHTQWGWRLSLFLPLNSGVIPRKSLGDYMRCWESNSSWLYARHTYILHPVLAPIMTVWKVNAILIKHLFFWGGTLVVGNLH